MAPFLPRQHQRPLPRPRRAPGAGPLGASSAKAARSLPTGGARATAALACPLQPGASWPSLIPEATADNARQLATLAATYTRA